MPGLPPPPLARTWQVRGSNVFFPDLDYLQAALLQVCVLGEIGVRAVQLWFQAGRCRDATLRAPELCWLGLGCGRGMQRDPVGDRHPLGLCVSSARGWMCCTLRVA